MKTTDQCKGLKEYAVTIRLDNADTDVRIWAENEATARKMGESFMSRWIPDGTITRGQVVALRLAHPIADSWVFPPYATRPALD